MSKHPLHIDRQNPRRGNTLLVTFATLTVLAAVVATVAMSVSSTANVSLRAASWQEAVVAAEAGVDSAMGCFRQALNEKSNWNSSGNALSDTQAASTAWKNGWIDAVTGQAPTATANPTKLSYTPSSTNTLTLFRAAGSGVTGMQAAVTIEAPTTWTSPTAQWYRIRSTGVSGVSGPPRTGSDKRDNDLMKLSLSLVRSALSGFPSGALSGTTGQAARSVEVIVKPISTSLISRALTVATTVKMSSSVMVDSFDSTDSSKSTNGQYDAAKRQSHGDVGSNDPASQINIGHANIYGNLAFNGGNISDVTYPENVHGTLSNNFYQQLVDINAPNWSAGTYTNQTINKSSYTLTGGTSSNPGKYYVNGTATLQSGNVLTFQKGNSGNNSYNNVQIWIDGDLILSSDGTVVIPQGMNVTFYISGKVQVTGSAFVNQTNTASALALYGIKPSNSSNPSWKVTSDGSFMGVFYAPEADFTLSGAGTFYGAAVVHNVAFGNGGTSFHYDEALARNGPGGTLSYQVASWVEDIR